MNAQIQPAAETVYRQQLAERARDEIHEHLRALRDILEIVIEDPIGFEPEERASRLSDALDHATYLEWLLERKEVAQ